MKLNFAERLLVNNTGRALVQRFYEGPLLRRFEGSLEGKMVLEVGCGRGVGVELLLTQFRAAHVCGLDLDTRHIKRARRRLEPRFKEHIDLYVANIESLPFADGGFDAVFDFGMLHHAPVWQTGIAEIQRVLKSDGTFFFEEVTRKALERWMYRTFLEHPVDNRFSEDEFITELIRHGLHPIKPLHKILLGDIFMGAARFAQS